MTIHDDFTGGNIRVVEIDGRDVYLENEIRDTSEDWFYWAFCVENAPVGRVNFHFNQKKRVGYWGAAVSRDLSDWKWLDNCDGEGFSYTFSEGESKVYFAHHILYHPDRFYKFCGDNGYTLKELCKTKKGRSLPCLEFGDGDISMILTARHHACESTGSYVLEGVLERFAQNPPNNVKIFCVPFVDLDGVLDGDQGKSRIPHDHNRDYIDSPLYSSVEEIMKHVDKNGCNYGFDFHAPGHKGGRHDMIYIVRNSEEKLSRFEKFGELLEKNLTEDSMRYSRENDYPPNTGWNVPSRNFGYTMNYRPECELAFTLESAYFGTAENKVSEARLKKLGFCFAEAILAYIKTKYE